MFVCNLFCTLCCGSSPFDTFRKWVNQCEHAKVSHKLRITIVHSPAFGGRGISLLCKTCSKKPQLGESRNHFTRACHLFHLYFACWLAIITAITAWTTLDEISADVFKFNSTLGFRGEGPINWSKNHPELSIATWNTRSLTFERFNYCKNLGHDVLAITELWRNSHKFTDDTVSFTHSVPKINVNTGRPAFPDDVAAGVGILLSERAHKQYMRHGIPCERLTWVRLKGPVTNLSVIAAYIPHRIRTKPCQHDTLCSLIELLKQVPKNDCVVLMGDFNEQLPKNIDKLTGKWAHGPESANTEITMNIMRVFDLTAASTFFQPKKKDLYIDLRVLRARLLQTKS